MVELPQDRLATLSRLYDAAQPISTMIYSTLAGRTLGRAFVDDVDAPHNALLVMNFQGFTFTHANVEQSWLNEAVVELRRQFGFFLNWPSYFSPALKPPTDYARTYAGYEFMEYHAQGELKVPANRQLRLMDAELLQRAMWRDLMLSAFGSAENFFVNGIGVCVMDGEEICSEAYAAFLGAGKYEIGIVTNEEYRRQGNAYLACKRLLQLVEESGYPPHCSYFEGNVASAATATKLGFGAQREYRWYHYPQV